MQQSLAGTPTQIISVALLTRKSYFQGLVCSSRTIVSRANLRNDAAIINPAILIRNTPGRAATIEIDHWTFLKV